MDLTGPLAPAILKLNGEFEVAIEFNKSAAAKNQDHLSRVGKSSRKETGAVGSAGEEGLRKESTYRDLKSPTPAQSFINTTNHGLKVKMPDSVHIFLPGETIEFLPKELGEDGAERELARRARRAEMKSKASMDWAKRNKGK